MASPTKFAGGAMKPTLSPREQEVLMAAWVCIKGAEPPVDYDRLARVLGLKNGHTASTIFSTVKKKAKAYRTYLADDDDKPVSPVVGASSSRKRAAGDRDAPSASKTKRARSKAPSPPAEAATTPHKKNTPQRAANSDYSGDI